MRVLGNATQNKYDIAVFIFTFNHEKYINQCIDSVIRQETKVNWHIFIHDDASNDGTQKILLDYYEKFPQRITLLLQKENQFRRGHPLGIDSFRISKSEFIAFCEGDDYWIDNKKLKKQYNFMQQNLWCGVLHSGVKVINQNGWNQYSNNLRRILRKNRCRKRYSGSKLTRGNFIMTCSVFLRRSELPEFLLESVGKLQPLDYILFSLATRFKDIGYQKKKMSVYRLHENNYFASEHNALITPNYRQTREFLDLHSPYNFKR
jgi:glycosyltransferase involved in cell wall biosynthesis